MSFSLQTHHFEKIPNTSQYKIARITPYVRLGSRDACFYIQGGKVYTENGPEVVDPPAWVFEQAARLTPETKAEIGWKDPEPKPVADATLHLPQGNQAKK